MKPLIKCSFGRLSELPVLGGAHLAAQLCEHRLKRVGTVPGAQDAELPRVHLPRGNLSSDEQEEEILAIFSRIRGLAA